MGRISVVPAFLKGSDISTEVTDKDLAQRVIDGEIIVLKDVFASDAACHLRDLSFNWGKQQIVSEQQDFYALKHNNHFCIERGVSKGQKTLHYYHSHNFSNFQQGLPPELSMLLTEFCIPLRDFYNRLTGNTADFTGEPRLHPQVIYYPSGAGLFAKHTHLFEPQKIGTITLLSKPAVDFRSGGACFEVNNEGLDVSPFHDIGDVALFRFDLPHWVSPIDIEEAVTPNSARGRWTLTLSYY